MTKFGEYENNCTQKQWI